jgi:hypothetical protein
MKRLLILLAGGLFLLFVPAARAQAPHIWYVTSPDHEQTFSYGTESHRAWSSHGSPRHLLLFLDYTNDPFVDRTDPREYDSFSFDFPGVKLQSDGRTFSYRAPDGRVIPVARRSSSFFSLGEIRLLPTSDLLIANPHGYLTLTLRIVE